MATPGDDDDFGEAFTDPRTVWTKRRLSGSVERPKVRRRPVVFVMSGPAVARQFVFPEGAKEVSIGRGENTDFRVADPSVSRKHAVFYVEEIDGDLRIFVEDIQSTNGSRIEGQVLRGRHEMTSGMNVTLGEMILKFELLTEEEIELQGGISKQVEAGRSDALTGLLSRRYLTEHLPSLVLSHRRHRIPLSVSLIDLDHFKRINDTLGHLAGDEVLRRTAEILRSRIRVADIPIRYGGEEFCILLPGAPREESARIGERVRIAIARHPFDDLSPALHVTASVGLATLGPNEEVESWLARTDEALYQAKRTGRDRVVVASEPSAAPSVSALRPR